MEDIFDAADLLAIEQDAQSSSCSDSANGGASDEDWGSPDQEDGDCEKQSSFQQSQEEGQTIHNSSTDVNVEESDEDSDDGFLTSMLALGKKSAQDVSALEEQEKMVQQESRRSDSSQHNFRGNDNIDESLATSENVKVVLGDSASRWITTYQTCKQMKHPQKNVEQERISNCIYNGVISIQNCGDSINDKSSVLQLSGNKRKRSGGREVAEATLQQLDVAQNETKTLLHGQAEFAPSAERSTLGTMVDCIARYDATKGSYVLEIVDLDVSASTLSGKSKDDERSSSMEHPSTIIADPRSRAKQAEKQVKKLEGDIRGLGGKLNNPGFTNKAPADVVERERGRLAEAEAQLAKITVAIHELRRG